MERNTLRRGILALAVLTCLWTIPVFSDDPTSSDDAQQVVAFVDRAAALLETKGMAAFPEFKVKGGEWWQGDSYIFVFDMTGTIFMHPIYYELEGANYAHVKDIQMKSFVKEGLQIASTTGSGWFDFLIPRPGLTTPTRRYVYIRTVNIPEGLTLIVGSGFWLE